MSGYLKLTFHYILSLLNKNDLTLVQLCTIDFRTVSVVVMGEDMMLEIIRFLLNYLTPECSETLAF